ncbi:MAG: phosphatase PAP2 family protein [Verrucomicrobiota bacterium]
MVRALFILFILFGLSFSLFAEEKLTFSNTMEWNPEYLAFTKKTPKLLPRDWQQLISIAPPPADDSAETRQELATLLTLVPQRAEAKAGVLAEQDVNEFILGGIRYGDLMDPIKYPATKALLDTVYYDLGVTVFTLKQKFDRVRPSFLESQLELLIPNPQHPAYPSGHSTCAHTFALVLGDLVPERKELMWQDAGGIAFRREVAGVHYASDSQAGKDLSRQIYTEFQKSVVYQKLLESARKEKIAVQKLLP